MEGAEMEGAMMQSEGESLKAFIRRINSSRISSSRSFGKNQRGGYGQALLD